MPVNVPYIPKLVSSDFFTRPQLKLLATGGPIVLEIPQDNGLLEAVVFTRSPVGLVDALQGAPHFEVISPPSPGMNECLIAFIPI